MRQNRMCGPVRIGEGEVMIHDILPHRYDVSYRRTKVRETDTVLVYREDGLLCRMENGRIYYPSAGDIAGIFPEVYEKAEFLFRIDETDYYELLGEGISEFSGWIYRNKESLRRAKPLFLAYAGITGFQIHKWRMENRFCGCCKARMQAHERERAMQCPSCKRVVYPKICPSVIAAVTDKDRILLTKYADGHSSFKKYALVAGYVEVGESLEDTVRREVFEEVGLRVKNIRYYKSQPWGFTDSLLAGFFCEVDGTAEITMDREELSEAEWFDRKHVPAERSEAGISLTGEMIDVWRDTSVV